MSPSSYNFEALGDDRFQQLCQGLLASTFPNIQLTPLGQSDGGRDAFLRIGRGRRRTLVFQVKYIDDYKGHRARTKLIAAIRNELPNIRKLQAAGLQQYYVLTNVSGSSTPESGSIDQLDSELSKLVGIDTHCWWRDDISRRIDSNSGLKWSFPDILRATDLLPLLFLNTSSTLQIAATRSYMTYQAKYDGQLRFKQIDLSQKIVDLFVDVPCRVLTDPSGRNRVGSDEDVVFPSPGDAPGTLQLLLSDQNDIPLSRVVLEGAPGQGKSTVTQFLCQVHRLRLLGRTADLKYLAKEYVPASLRVPFRIDLRDYAGWLVGRDPFSSDPTDKRDPSASPILESFVAAQVSRYTGALFTTDQLSQLLMSSHALFVLDGFDEVADVDLRNRVVTEISDAADRITANAVSARFVVTSRPAAFSNSPGFSKTEWQHIELLPLPPATISQYAQKWLLGRNAEAHEQTEVLRVLHEKLGLDHVRDLAKNPMQLAILLTLIVVQGSSLPDKRTALYDRYFDIFLNRESEKTPAIRRHRDLIVQLHRYLAWTLHVQAERSGAGHISEQQLRALLSSYLSDNDHSRAHVDELFDGMVERVVALVSRVKGTYEFEVQPLREYFAARFLYDTAPYVSAGIEARGTLLDRFDALARNSFWINVTRFYAGCYSTGELSSLVDGLDTLGADPLFINTKRVTWLRATLLSDFVFSQQPRIAMKIAAPAATEHGLRLLFAANQPGASVPSFSWPEGAARTALVDAAWHLLANARDSRDYGEAAASLIHVNSDFDAYYSRWIAMRSTLNASHWTRVGRFLSLLATLPQSDVVHLASDHLDILIDLYYGERYDVLTSADLWSLLERHIADGAILAFDDGAPHEGRVAWLLMHTLSGDAGPFVAREYGDVTWFDTSIFGRRVQKPRLDLDVPSRGEDGRLSELLIAFVTLPLDTLAANYEVAEATVEGVRSVWGATAGICQFACKLAVFFGPSSGSHATIDLFDNTIPLLRRLRHVLTRSASAAWWRSQLSRLGADLTPADQFTIVFAVRMLMSTATLVRLQEHISMLLDNVAPAAWSQAHKVSRYYYYPTPNRLIIDIDDYRKVTHPVADRFASILMLRGNSETQTELWRSVFRDSDCNDEVFCSMASEHTTSLGAVIAEDWPLTLRCIARNYSKGYTLSIYNEEVWREMPEEHAEMVCSQAALFPSSLVSVAQRRVAAKAGRAALGVGMIAERDAWSGVAG